MVTSVSADFPHVYIVNASAGSGKTYRLALRYLTLVLSPYISSDIKEILAITFTNKAAKEMRERILGWLKKIALGILDSQEKTILEKVIGIEPDSFRKRACEVLDYIIKNYEYFRVDTIDSFMNVIVNASCIHFGISPNFKIEEEYTSYLEYSLDEFIRRAEYDECIHRLFKEFLAHYLEVEYRTHWFPKRDILKLISLLFRHVNLKGKMFTTLINADNLKKEIIAIREILKKLLIYLEPSTRFYNTLTKALEEDNVFVSLEKLIRYLSKEDFNVKVKDDRFFSLWETLKERVKMLYETYAFSRFNPYVGMFSHIMDIFQRLEKEKDIIFLEELNKKVKELSKSAEFVFHIYSYLSLKFTHYLLDEFQDTSRIQWENLKPLIEEAISRGGSLFYVGDRKQAIYRFRAGEVSLFDQVKEEFKERAKIIEENLSCNFRSQKTIVDFNNRLFSSSWIKQFLEEANIDISSQSLQSIMDNFKEAQQERLPQKSSGYVYAELVRFNNAEERDELIKEKLVSLLKELMERFSSSDIAILLRDNEQVKKITTWLMESSIPVESEKTSDIRQNYLIKEIISLLKFLNSPIDDLSFASFILGDIFLKVSGLSKDVLEEFIFSHKEKGYLYRSFRNKFPQLWNDFFEEFFKSVGFLPLYEFLVSIFEKFKVLLNFPEYQGYFMKLLQLVHEKEREDIIGLREFLRYFESGISGDDFFVELPYGMNAIKVLTIHKAKGLEFKVVVCPFLSIVPVVGEKRGQNRLIFDDKDNLYLVYIKKDFTLLSTKLKKIYEQEYVNSLLDELNICYVALTRAVEELYIFVPEKVGTHKNLAKSFIFFQQEEKIEIGKRQAYYKEKLSFPKFLPSSSFQDWCKYLEEEFIKRKDLQRKEKLEKGEILHILLSHIDNLQGKDVSFVIEEAVKNTLLFSSLLSEEELREILNRILFSPSLKHFFFLPKEVKVYTEKELIDERGNIKRPDRIIVFEDKAWVVDYKSSKEDLSSHLNQIEEYKKLVGDIFSKPCKGYLVYLDSLEVVGV